MKRLVFIFIALASAITLMAQPPTEVLQRESAGHPDIDHTIVRTNKITYSNLGEHKQYQMILNDTSRAVSYYRHYQRCGTKDTPEDE